MGVCYTLLNITLYHQMKKIASFLNLFNILESPLIIKTNQRSQTFNLCTFLVSLALLSLFFYFFVSNMVALSDQTNIMTRVTQKKLLNEQPFKVYPLFAFALPKLNIELSNYFNIKISIVKKKNFTNYQRFPVSISKCNISQWSKLIDKQQLDFYGISSLYCPNLSADDFIGGTYYAADSSTIQFSVSLCGLPGPQCFQFSTGLQQQRINIFFIDQIINQNDKLPLKYFINSKYYGQIGSNNLYQQLQFQLQYFDIHTGHSFFPSENGNLLQGASLSNSKYKDYINAEDEQYLFKMNVQMGQRFKSYYRRVEQVQNVFALSGGFLFIIFVIARFILNDYIEFHSDMSMAIGLFRKDGDLIRDNQAGFCKYVKFLVFRLLGLQKKYNIDDCRRMSLSLNQVRQVTDYNIVIRRLHLLEKAIQQLSSSEQLACLSLVIPLSIQEAEGHRLKSEYFQYVTQSKNRVTIWDVRKVFYSFDLSLEHFYDKISDPHNSVILLLIQKNPEGLTDKKNCEDPNQIGRNQIIESASGIKNEQLNYQFKNRKRRQTKKEKSSLALMEKVISLFEEIKKEAQNISLPQYLEEAEKKIAASFRNMKSEPRCNFQETIPIIILHRLVLAISKYQIKKRKSEQVEKSLKTQERLGSLQTLSMSKSFNQQKFDESLMKRATVKYKQAQQKQQRYEEPKATKGRIGQDMD